MAILQDTLEASRFHSDRARYGEAAGILRDFHNRGYSSLYTVLELVRVLKNQGYWRDALDTLLAQTLPPLSVETEVGCLAIRARMEICLLQMFVTASFDGPLHEAERLRHQTSDFVALQNFDPTAAGSIPLTTVSFIPIFR